MFIDPSAISMPNEKPIAALENAYRSRGARGDFAHRIRGGGPRIPLTLPVTTARIRPRAT
ncbi:hypothetical protein WS87_30575 [Burkholderia sp. MSMB0856]|uniref:hypothetical protein n=1 Tax=Burkholderia sp. MSMB0856 TaxID=1637869 RepID=UPI0007577BA5|nr:hypothetical protein [Burkholderia sp. MSMB0856]AOJ91088.1 hypothetical protein WS87_30575 [Burkholderia sp. MSMB0856]KVH31518.1 hypothetical protein WS87_24735 [Burkholderia sp. MSMB0856]